jgi:hypothetical protein
MDLLVYCIFTPKMQNLHTIPRIISLRAFLALSESDFIGPGFPMTGHSN